MELIKDKQMVAIADYFAEKISDENAPVDFKSPIKLKGDVEKKEKILQGEAPGGKSDDSGSGDSSDDKDSGDDSSGDEGEEDTPEDKPAETPTFGLG